MNSPTSTSFQNPSGHEIDFDMLREFEVGLDPLHPERSQVPCRVLGYGEISTVFEIHVNSMEGLAFKRLSIFETVEEMTTYLATYQEYNKLLEEDIGIQIPTHGHAAFTDNDGDPIFYIIQAKVPVPSIGNKALHLVPQEETSAIFECVLRELLKVWQFNQSQTIHQVGIDGQVSNWVIQDFDTNNPCLDENTCLYYVDTSTPFIRTQGVEQLNQELFLRSAPSFLVWILRIFFMEEVVDRYYDLRKVVIDLLANCCKEQKPELIPGLVDLANEFFAKEAADLNIQPIEEREIFSYYREDALIWSLYLNMRYFDRFLHKITGREYPYILPEKIKR